MSGTHRCQSLIMVGTHHLTMGGIATVVRGYRDGGLFRRFRSAYVVTHVDGSAVHKAVAAIAAGFRFVWLLMILPAPLIHIHLSSRASFWRKCLFCLLAMAFRRPYLLHMHGSEFMQFHDQEAGTWTRRLIRFCFRNAVAMLALSTEWRDNLLRICPAAKVEVLPNAVAVPELDVSQLEPADPVRLLFLGRLGRRKGAYELIEAFARIAPRYPRTQLVCAGDGEIAEISAAAAAHGLTDRVHCPGWLDVRAARTELESARVFVLPSYAEGVPMALLEAMASGLAVVTTPVGGIPEVVRDGDNGLLVQPGNVDELVAALGRVLGDVALRQSLGARARATIVARYSLNAAVDRLAALYRRCGLAPLPG